MKSILISLIFFVPAVYAADVTLEPNGKVVNINGATVTCNDGGFSGVESAPDEVVVGMARGRRLGNCSVTLVNSTIYVIYLRAANNGETEVGRSTSLSATAQNLRGYVAAGACSN